MQDKVPEWAQAIGALIVLGLCATLALVAAGGWEWFAKFLEGSAASWVGAIGTILAIFGAGAIADRQANRSNSEAYRLQRRLETSRALSIDFILRQARLVVTKAEQNVRHPPSKGIDVVRKQVEMVQQALRALPVFDIPSPRVVFDLQRIDRDLLYILLMLDEVGTEEGEVRIGRGSQVFSIVLLNIDKARKALIHVFDQEALRDAHLIGYGSLWDEADSPEPAMKTRDQAAARP